MKKLLIGLLALSSVSIYAAPCSVLALNLKDSEIRNVKKSLKASEISVVSNDVYDYGIIKKNQRVYTDKINPFGKRITRKESKFSLYENGNVVLETEFKNSVDSLNEIITKLKALRCD